MRDADDDPTARRAAVETALVEAHRDIYRFLCRRLGDEQDARDVLQAFSLRVLTRYGELRDTDRLRGWMSRILHTVLTDHYRAGQRRGRLHDRLAAEPGADDRAEPAPDDALDGAVCACLYTLLPTLRPAEADLIRRLDLLEEPRAAVAADLGITPAALRVRLHRARQALRTRLEQSCLTCVVHGFLDCGCPGAEALQRRLATALDDPARSRMWSG
ncbi:sigma-70 family RNA polymerase sigma factor [Rhodothalassium salexigens]|uniref:sigma-70 family RNA polymerase sigma factor n=1 Tax=Rhodothalassium salexigens TaxID=1086 RepID=UPI0019130B62